MRKKLFEEGQNVCKEAIANRLRNLCPNTICKKVLDILNDCKNKSEFENYSYEQLKEVKKTLEYFYNNCYDRKLFKKILNSKCMLLEEIEEIKKLASCKKLFENISINFTKYIYVISHSDHPNLLKMLKDIIAGSTKCKEDLKYCDFDKFSSIFCVSSYAKFEKEDFIKYLDNFIYTVIAKLKDRQFITKKLHPEVQKILKSEKNNMQLTVK